MLQPKLLFNVTQMSFKAKEIYVGGEAELGNVISGVRDLLLFFPLHFADFKIFSFVVFIFSH